LTKKHLDKKTPALLSQGSPKFLEKDNKNSILLGKNKFVSNMLAPAAGLEPLSVALAG